MMDMDMSGGSGSGGVPWLDQPVMLHSSRADSCSMTPEQCAYRNYHWRYWYEADHVYSLNTVYFFCATIGVFAIANFLAKYAPVQVKRSAAWKKATAGLRYLAYRGYELPVVRYWSPSLGVILLGLAGTVFCFAMTLGPKPYYWPEVQTGSYGSSPPIATRTGWMALAVLPFVLAFGAKANMISALTGVPHEKLQVFHQWSSYAMFVLGLIHTFPFIVYHIHKGDMVMEWNTSLTYWTGVATLIPQAYLTVMSLPSIRNRYYEFFKATHFIVALLFILFFFFHCDFRLSSWYDIPLHTLMSANSTRDYFIAAGAIYLLSLFTAQIRTYFIHGVHSATLDLLPSGLLRVKVPTIISWHPGQHVFVRFFTLGLHSLTAHPFTISSIAYDPERVGKASEIVFYIKPKHGVTGRLAKIAEKSPSCTRKVLLEGPYGGLSETRLGQFDHILVIAGGSGGGFSLSVLEEALKQPSLAHGNIQIVFATRQQNMADWYIDEVETKLSTFNASKNNSISVYITSHNQPAPTNKDTTDPDPDAEPSDTKNKDLPEQNVTSASTCSGSYSIAVNRPFRPNLPEIVAAATNRESGKRVGVFVCGPASMLHDTRNAAARAQREVLRGNVEEVFLHTEPFSW
ncbi:ferric reductase family protein [Aspergillus chevalieri]|uniref:ferric-chelate reductase (NADPH) n=1 Tax=Aspergillus chevalieri TaxID=182096 RepID=A0A7R7VLY6_ASPCH|nr:uncharacterized protein ACHE_31135A [Aspergillus chevalieri]BCR87148.1 hypothetical protein ACHE_31135A [Aspergillus chevalieri]